MFEIGELITHIELNDIKQYIYIVLVLTYLLIKRRIVVYSPFSMLHMLEIAEVDRIIEVM